MKLNLVFELDQKVVKFEICFLPKPKGFKNMKNHATPEKHTLTKKERKRKFSVKTRTRGSLVKLANTCSEVCK